MVTVPFSQCQCDLLQEGQGFVDVSGLTLSVAYRLEERKQLLCDRQGLRKGTTWSRTKSLSFWYQIVAPIRENTMKLEHNEI